MLDNLYNGLQSIESTCARKEIKEVSKKVLNFSEYRTHLKLYLNTTSSILCEEIHFQTKHEEPQCEADLTRI